MPGARGRALSRRQRSDDEHADTLEYAAHRKLQVYESAVAEAMQGGGISDKERALLSRLRDTLGIAKADADALERDLQRDTASASLTS